MASNATDTARPKFYVDAVQNKALSEEEGRPIFENKEMVKIEIPGDKLTNYVGVVSEAEKQRWPEHYAAFKRGEALAAIGTPLEHWPNAALTKARVAELKACNILSVEELANIPDNTLTKVGMDARPLREQAREYIAKAKDGAKDSAMAARIAQLEQMVERLAGGSAAAAEAPKQEKTLEDCTDAELKEFIKRETGEGVRGNPSRETLLTRAAELAEKQAA